MVQLSVCNNSIFFPSQVHFKLKQTHMWKQKMFYLEKINLLIFRSQLQLILLWTMQLPFYPVKDLLLHFGIFFSYWFYMVHFPACLMLSMAKKSFERKQGLFYVLTQSTYPGTNWANLPAKVWELVLLLRKRVCLCVCLTEVKIRHRLTWILQATVVNNDCCYETNHLVNWGW